MAMKLLFNIKSLLELIPAVLPVGLWSSDFYPDTALDSANRISLYCLLKSKKLHFNYFKIQKKICNIKFHAQLERHRIFFSFMHVNLKRTSATMVVFVLPKVLPVSWTFPFRFQSCPGQHSESNV